jgi:hypothetical protein
MSSQQKMFGYLICTWSDIVISNLILKIPLFHALEEGMGSQRALSELLMDI